MIIVTSISPGHANKDSQEIAIESWQGKGKCFSINELREWSSMTSCGKIILIPTNKTIEYFVGKPLVCICAMIDFAESENEDLLLINSDIILQDILPELKQDGVTIFSRYDFDTGVKFEYGFDVFYIPKKFLKLFPPTIYAMGVAFWDYWLPKHCIRLGIPLYYPEGKYAFHKAHQTQYSITEWEYIGEFFRWEFKYPKHLTIPQVATQALNEIKSKLIV